MFTAWSGFEGRFVYVEAGPNFHELGLLRTVEYDQLGRAWGILDRTRRIGWDNEDGPQEVAQNTGDGLRIVDTAVTHVQLAEDRWPRWKPPE